MNVQTLKQTNVTQTLCVTTRKDHTPVAVLMDFRVMVKTVQVNISFFFPLVLSSLYNFQLQYRGFQRFSLRTKFDISLQANFWQNCRQNFEKVLVIAAKFCSNSRNSRIIGIVCFTSLAIVTGCSPSCGPNASCLESGGLPVCECNPGFEGDGFVCAGQ